jgi:hypothetical protein
VITIRRTGTYLLALAGLLVSVAASAGMVSLIISTLVLPSDTILSGDDVRTRASLYLAELVVGLPVWLGYWLAAERGVARKSEEPNSVQRRLFLATVFAVTSVVALVALHDLLRFVLTLPGATATPASRDAAIRAATRFLAFGAAWLGYVRLGHPRPAGPGDARTLDQAHDLAVYILTGVALAFLLTGVAEAIVEITKDVLGTEQTDLLSPAQQGLWTIWGSIAAWTLAGGGVWAAIWRYDLARAGRRPLRVLYLYIVLVVAVPVTLGGGADGLYELLRRLFGYQSATGYREFLPDVLTALFAGGATWAYHWHIVRQQAHYADEPQDTPLSGMETSRAANAAGTSTRPGDVETAIVWPRRPGLALLALAGLAACAPAFVSLLWLALDFLLNSGASLSGPDWWRDRLSASVAIGIVGTAAWLSAWWRLQRAAMDDMRERATQERRLLLGFIAVVGSLFAFGFLIALLWLAFRALLGAPLGPNGLSTALKEFSAALVSLLLAAYHAVLLRTDIAKRPAQPVEIRVRALVAPGAEASLRAFQQERSLHLDVAGYLLDDLPATQLSLPALLERLTTQGATDESEQILLVLGADGGLILRYRR